MNNRYKHNQDTGDEERTRDRTGNHLGQAQCSHGLGQLHTPCRRHSYAHRHSGHLHLPRETGHPDAVGDSRHQAGLQ